MVGAACGWILVATAALWIHAAYACDAWEFACGSGGVCVKVTAYCNGVAECPDASDEADCPTESPPRNPPTAPPGCSDDRGCTAAAARTASLPVGAIVGVTFAAVVCVVFGVVAVVFSFHYRRKSMARAAERDVLQAVRQVAGGGRLPYILPREALLRQQPPRYTSHASLNDLAIENPGFRDDETRSDVPAALGEMRFGAGEPPGYAPPLYRSTPQLSGAVSVTSIDREPPPRYSSRGDLSQAGDRRPSSQLLELPLLSRLHGNGSLGDGYLGNASLGNGALGDRALSDQSFLEEQQVLYMQARDAMLLRLKAVVADHQTAVTETSSVAGVQQEAAGSEQTECDADHLQGSRGSGDADTSQVEGMEKSFDIMDTSLKSVAFHFHAKSCHEAKSCEAKSCEAKSREAKSCEAKSRDKDSLSLSAAKGSQKQQLRVETNCPLWRARSCGDVAGPWHGFSAPSRQDVLYGVDVDQTKSHQALERIVDSGQAKAGSLAHVVDCGGQRCLSRSVPHIVLSHASHACHC